MSVKQLVTAEELWAMPEIPGKRYELVKGELVEVPGAGGLHAQLVMTIVLVLHPFVVERNLGQVFADGLGFLLGRDPDVVRIPDASFISREHIPTGGIPEGYIPFAPDLAVEIVSPGDRAVEVYGKVREYLEAGVRLVWVLWPKYRSISVHAAGGVTRELGPDDELDGGDVLPGVRVRVGELFAAAR